MNKLTYKIATGLAASAFLAAAFAPAAFADTTIDVSDNGASSHNTVNVPLPLNRIPAEILRMVIPEVMSLSIPVLPRHQLQ
jgi:hypothetical protein